MSWEQKIVGKVVTKATVVDDFDGDKLIMEFVDGSSLKMFHYQDCCESVSLEAYSQEELNELIGQTVLSAYETSDYQTTEYGDQCYTFYSIQGNQSSATLRWYGESNGYYSVEVTVEFNDKKT